jgi:hypothetical protein
MALTAAIRTILITLIATGVGWLVDKLNLAGLFDVQPVAEVIANMVIVFGSGLVAYTVNKLGSRWAFINYILSLGRAKSPAVYIPGDKENATAFSTPPGEQTQVVTTDADGQRELVAV